MLTDNIDTTILVTDEARKVSLRSTNGQANQCFITITTIGNKIMLTEQQLAERHQYIGGTDLGAIFGLSPWKTPYQLYLEKIGMIQPVEQTESMYWGSQLEGIIRDEFCKRNNVVCETPDTITHPEYSFIRANIDGYIREDNYVLEVKTVSAFSASEFGEQGTDQIPLQYLLQVAHYCMVVNASEARIATLIGGNTYKEYKYIRNAELETKILSACIKFWDCVQNRIPPQPVNIDDLRLMYPLPIPSKAIALQDWDDFDEYVSSRLKSKLLDDQQEELKFKLMKYMGDAETLVGCGGEILATWKANKNGKRTFLVKMMGDK